jgi:hypothetical protein
MNANLGSRVSTEGRTREESKIKAFELKSNPLKDTSTVRALATCKSRGAPQTRDALERTLQDARVDEANLHTQVPVDVNLVPRTVIAPTAEALPLLGCRESRD